MCELKNELELLHKWVHRCAVLSEEDIEKAEQLSKRVIDILNRVDASNGVKLLAMYDVVTSGVWHMEQTTAPDVPEPDPDAPATIH
jgi:hypothetical protein